MGDKVHDAVARLFLLRRLVTLWALRPLLAGRHDRAETAFLGWFGPVGVSALFYATLAERRTGDDDVFVWVTLAITGSVVVHGLTSAPFSTWLGRREPGTKERQDTSA